jgi:hypothetical protein
MEDANNGVPDGGRSLSDGVDDDRQRDDSEAMDESDLDDLAGNPGNNVDSPMWLSWRDEPATTFSDFTLEIEATPADDGQDPREAVKKPYHVHKAIIAVGLRKSIYFERLFRSEKFRENVEGVIQLSLPPSQADVFPALLDYQYNPREAFEFSSINVLSLYELGQYFDVPQLRKDAREFWKHDLRAENCHIYFDQATLCGNNSVLQVIMQISITHSRDVARNKMLFHSTPPRFWLRMLKFYSKRAREGSFGWPMCTISNVLIQTLVAERAWECFSLDIFFGLTDDTILPVVESPETALTLLQYEMQLNREKRELTPTELPSLQRRCLDALKKWLSQQLDTSARAEFEREVVQRLRTVDPLLVEIFLTEALECERARVAQLDEMVERARCRGINIC